MNTKHELRKPGLPIFAHTHGRVKAYFVIISHFIHKHHERDRKVEQEHDQMY